MTPFCQKTSCACAKHKSLHASSVSFVRSGERGSSELVSEEGRRVTRWAKRPAAFCFVAAPRLGVSSTRRGELGRRGEAHLKSGDTSLHPLPFTPPLPDPQGAVHAGQVEQDGEALKLPVWEGDQKGGRGGLEGA